MIKYTTRYVNVISLLITIIVYFLVNICIVGFQCSKFPSISKLFAKSKITVELNSDNTNKDTEEENIPKITQQNTEVKERKWKITIPSIELDAEISEGTSKEIMDKYVGHFSETSKTIGNIGLAAHNRGYPVNYFSDIKKLRKGDKIIYKFNNFEKTYVVNENKIIKDTDWEPLEDTEENKITLITCVENQPEYRRCIQGVEELKLHKYVDNF